MSSLKCVCQFTTSLTQPKTCLTWSTCSIDTQDVRPSRPTSATENMTRPEIAPKSFLPRQPPNPASLRLLRPRWPSSSALRPPSRRRYLLRPPPTPLQQKTFHLLLFSHLHFFYYYQLNRECKGQVSVSVSFSPT